MTEKRKFNPLFPTLIMGAGERPTYFKMAKNVKSLIIFARDCRSRLHTGCIKKPANTIICIILLLTSISMSALLISLLGFENNRVDRN
jgi:hypothetical protein